MLKLIKLWNKVDGMFETKYDTPICLIKNRQIGDKNIDGNWDDD